VRDSFLTFFGFFFIPPHFRCVDVSVGDATCGCVGRSAAVQRTATRRLCTELEFHQSNFGNV
jgi:hypothetical protein